MYRLPPGRECSLARGEIFYDDYDFHVRGLKFFDDADSCLLSLGYFDNWDVREFKLEPGERIVGVARN